MTAGGRAFRASAFALTVFAVLPLAACTGNLLPGATTTAPPAPDGAGIPAGDEQAIVRAIDTFNAAAAGPVGDQQAVLTGLIDPALIDTLGQCPPATATLRFEPIYSALRAAPDWTPSSGVLGGTVYALPTLIRVYTGDRVTGTDLTTLHLGVRTGEAYLTPLCVG